jgi:T3SS negative regulator,GrlR
MAAFTMSKECGGPATKELHMNDGIYHVRFTAGHGQLGEGLAVVKNGKVNGGDEGYLYTGTLIQSGITATSQLHIKQWNPNSRSVFGPLKAFDLTLAGSTSGDEFTVNGSITGQPGQRIQIVGKFISPAA